MGQIHDDYYATLEVDSQASAEEIRESYRRLVFKYHPDRNQGNKNAKEKMQEINAAYAVLGDPEKRKAYDLIWLDYYASLKLDDERQNGPVAEPPQSTPPPDQGRESGARWEENLGCFLAALLPFFLAFMLYFLELNPTKGLGLFIYAALFYFVFWVWLKFVDRKR